MVQDISKLIHEKVFGRDSVVGDDGKDYDEKTSERVLPYAADVTAALMVLEKLRPLEPCVEWNDVQSVWIVCFQNYTEDATAHSDSMPLAICLAALLTCGMDITDFVES